MSDFLQIEPRDRVLTIALNRPEKRNALSAELCRDLVDALNGANRDGSVGAILLTGNGPAFSAGMDLQEVAHLSPQSLSNVHEQLFTVGSRLGKPLVVAVNGGAFGGGMGLVANGHVVIASEQAKFGLTEIRLGLWPFLVYQAVSAALGERRAVELALTGRIFDAAEARSLSLVHEIAADPAARAMEIATGLSQSSPTAIRSGLSFVEESRGKNPASGVEIARRVREELMGTADFQEGIRAFLEKRQPTWPSLGLKKQI
ncbi:MAG TPA: enoyl-CoA hydratase/isomerase family protein [Candidatus Sulfopaludibacter sp.]|jgi:enoyl-CoA hydratase/carnithine racemase|nr:enoyl-CoA hydratase/isomerase family protein [Candidatus Sulfopaludibacter sp.]